MYSVLAIYKALRKICLHQYENDGSIKGVTTDMLSSYLKMQRSNVSRELSKLIDDGSIHKTTGRPVFYYIKIEKLKEDADKCENVSVFDNCIGKDTSLKHQIALAKAAVVYPPNGLHTLIVGETGVGKSYFAKCIFRYALEIGRVRDKNKFAVFNCADYANNAQLLISHLFGVKKGTYTGAHEDREGIVEKSRDGILFLDEVHRLPPEGQEMLFTLIDEGQYIPLGGTTPIKINVMIISATTENISSVLLKTFARRIPVTISLPPLREWSVNERLELIKNFLNAESKRVSKKIQIEEEALTAIINYRCPNNIGQLKSDLQIASAKAFLRSMFNNDNIKIRLEDFSKEIRNSLLFTKKINPRELTLDCYDTTITNDIEDLKDKYTISPNIYDFIDKRTESLKEKGNNQDEIKNRLVVDVGKFINNYIHNIREDENEDIKVIVNNELYDMLKSFMKLAEYKLKREIPRSIFIGLLMHIDTFLVRIKQNIVIENPKIDSVRKKYPQEFKLALLLSYKLEEKYNITVPIGEIGFITMFFAADYSVEKGKVAIIVAMHGNSTASSMVEVSNSLLNSNYAVGFDMPLYMKPEEALLKIEELVKEKDEGKGTLILADMGSLKYFSNIIKENTGIRVETVDMVSTPIVIEATRKALLNESLDEILKSVATESKYVGGSIDKKINKNTKVIITACLTGQGTAHKLKQLIYNKFNKDEYEVFNLSMKDKSEFKEAVLKIKKEHDIEYIISAFNPEVEGINYISIGDFFNEFMDKPIDVDAEENEVIKGIKAVYRYCLNLDNYEFITNKFVEILDHMKQEYEILIDIEKFNGLLMHFGCLIEKLVNREETGKCSNLQLILSRYSELFNTLKIGIVDIEEVLGIVIPDDELGNIIEILVNI
ncbi:sigma 54-interacting transcriptional regulator [Clostridium brassicae]|uniref:Sigma 54-interacting transcriptional regulator n=1 Tax=Clostridium brassicae TaxID=2999072 RepID=A0ABT4DCM0_9CLOT|nr:sigma 54-interacting transcriptional regulator [Clostridium brassicae]MCY6960060.1 sigma 54-interacting transcriptional regulator [Clostridium brassicae]